MTIHIEALTFEAIIGLLDFERERPQRIIVDLEATYTYEDTFLDYAKIVEMITIHIKNKRYELLEDALLGIKEELLEHYHQITSLKLKISKPDIISECSVALSHFWEFNS
ncbi:dihydroneopterin aldolase [Sulfurovum sp. zt1-1]|uniref:Dihydroneopterin aldolase n=1 Tax=Sulfurovum zhangzhouensis TaxID=3019067 RepID=A0ABT7QWU2_9BACT|nr:dihydroneopterin aldolase [Sulfurovum zhangzhouensis]MDM5271302.1 dihydroneopterin aldolase [Sulfurovum zhangzhouensis]